MRRRLLVALVALLVTASGSALAAVTADEVHPDDFPDPFLVIGPDGMTYAFATNGAGGTVPTMRSADLRRWDRLPDAMPRLPSWAEPGHTWAPAVVQRGPRWVLYFTARHRGTGRQCIGAATSSAIQGPYVDPAPQPFLCQFDRGGSIDASVVVDGIHTQLLWKSEGIAGSEPTRLWSQELSSDGLSLVGAGPAELLRTDQPWEEPIIEGPTMVGAAGAFWLFYSGSHWESDQYAIGVARCASPSGPCMKSGGSPWLASGAGPGLVGPGGPEVHRRPDGSLVLAFHAWSRSVGYRNGGRRTLRLAPLRVEGGRPLLPGMPAPAVDGYRFAASDGGIFSFGADAFFGSTGDQRLNRPIVGMAATPSGHGYWLVASDGGIFAFGDASFFGSTGDRRLNKPIVAMVPTPAGRGYWLVASDGGIFAFGDAEFFGSTGAMRLNRPIVGMAATASGRGYSLVASDGGMFTFGDAPFHGSTGSMTLASPIVSIASRPWSDGYWLVAADGGVFGFGPGARFLGSAGDQRLNHPIVRAASTPTGEGYWLVASDGGVFSYGDAAFFGSTGDITLNHPIVSMAA